MKKPVSQTVSLYPALTRGVSQCRTAPRYMSYDVFPCVVNLLGGTVHLVCRNKDRADEARKHIVEMSKNEVNVFILKTIALILSCHTKRKVSIPIFSNMTKE